MQRVLITGAEGFLGSHLCDRFIAEGMEVLGMDNLITGNMENLEHLMGYPKFTFYNNDVSNFVHVPGEFDYILHFASQTRSFCYVDDLVEGIYSLLMSDQAKPVNIGNPHEITISDFAEEIIKLTGTRQKVIYKPLPVNDPMQRKPDISKAKTILGCEPKVMRDEGLKRTYEWFKSLSDERLYRKEHRDFAEYILK